MEFLYFFIGIAVGALSGFFVSKKLSASEQDFKLLEQESQKTKMTFEQYQQEVAEHLEQSAHMLAQMNSACHSAMEQMEKSTQLLKKANTEQPVMPFFSEEAEQHIRSNSARTKRHKSIEAPAPTEQPRDYSSDPSGIFSDQKQIVTNN
ncbi:YhcB family protein [Thalassotalea aquiviva]|uniref:YhcB family protein n=1 Tax=Thalassotalea aquiviva TaxID=3242415 RepID=UPI00352BA1BB